MVYSSYPKRLLYIIKIIKNVSSNFIYFYRKLGIHQIQINRKDSVMQYQIKLTNGESFIIECKPVVSNSTLILNSNKAMLASYNASQWLKCERIDLDDIIANSEVVEE